LERSEIMSMYETKGKYSTRQAPKILIGFSLIQALKIK